jgi:hypothetical protein
VTLASADRRFSVTETPLAEDDLKKHDDTIRLADLVVLIGCERVVDRPSKVNDMLVQVGR